VSQLRVSTKAGQLQGYLASKNNEKVSRSIAGWDRKVAYFLKVKDEIFTPIYNDLVRFKRELTSGEKEGWQPWNDEDYWWDRGLGVAVRDIDSKPPWYCPSFVEWNKIILVPDLYIQVPEEAKDRLDKFIDLLEKYDNTQEEYYDDIGESLGLCLWIRSGQRMVCWESRYIGCRAIVRDRESILEMCRREIPQPFQYRVSDVQLQKDVNEFIELFADDPRVRILKEMSPVIIEETDSMIAYFYDEIRKVIHAYELGEIEPSKGSWLVRMFKKSIAKTFG
jgi:hypothetical protein